MAGPIEVIALLAIVGGMTAGAVYFSASRRLRRAMRRVKLVSIADFPEGDVGKIAGVIRLIDPELRAPITQARCVCYETVASRFVPPRTSDRIAREVKAVSFAVEDATGRAIVNPVNAQVTLEQDDERSHQHDPASPAQESFLSRHRVDPRRWVGAASILYAEGFLAEGDRVVIVGRGTRRASGDGSILHVGGAASPVQISDHDDAIA